MNQLSAKTISLRNQMPRDDGWDDVEGKKVFLKLKEEVLAAPEVDLFYISFTGVRRIDASFPRESVIALAKTFSETKAFCLRDFSNKVQIDNCEGGAQKLEFPVTVLALDGVPEFVGKHYECPWAGAVPNYRAASAPGRATCPSPDVSGQARPQSRTTVTRPKCPPRRTVTRRGDRCAQNRSRREQPGLSGSECQPGTRDRTGEPH